MGLVGSENLFLVAARISQVIQKDKHGVVNEATATRGGRRKVR